MSANDLSRLPDDDLMVLVANGVIEQPAEELYRRHSAVLYGFVSQLCKGDAARAAYYMEQVWVQLLTRCSDYTAHADFRGFLLSVATQIVGAAENVAGQSATSPTTLPPDETVNARIHELTLQVQAAQAPRRRALMSELAKGKRTSAALGSKVSRRTWFWLRTHRRIREAEKAKAARRVPWHRIPWRNVGVALAALFTAAMGTHWFFARQAREAALFPAATPRTEASAVVAQSLPGRLERPTRPERPERSPRAPLSPAPAVPVQTNPAISQPSEHASAAAPLPAVPQISSQSAPGTTTSSPASGDPATPDSKAAEQPSSIDAQLEQDPSRALRALPFPRGQFKVIAHVAQRERPAVQVWLARLQSTLPPDAPLEIAESDDVPPEVVRIEIAPRQ